MSVSLLAEKKQNIRKNRIILWGVFLAILVAISDSRIGNDHESYCLGVTNANSLSDFFDSHYEPGAYFTMYLFNKIGGGCSLWIGTMSLLQWMLIYNVARKINIARVEWVMLFYFAYFFLYCHFNVVRHGVSMSFVWLAFSYIIDKNIKRYLLYIVVGACFHKLAICMLPIYWIVTLNCGLKKSLIILCGCYIFGGLISDKIFALGLFADNVEYYLEDYNLSLELSSSITVGQILYITIFILSFMYKDRQNYVHFNLVRNILLYSLCCAFIFRGSGVFSERIVGMLNFSLCLFVPFFFSVTKISYRFLFKSLLVIYCCLYLHQMCNNIRSGSEYQFVPYRISKSFN